MGADLNNEIARRAAEELTKSTGRPFVYNQDKPGEISLPGGYKISVISRYGCLDVILDGNDVGRGKVFDKIKKEGLAKLTSPSDKVLASSQLVRDMGDYAVRLQFRKTAFLRGYREARGRVNDRIYAAVKRTAIDPIVNVFIEKGVDKGAFE